MGYILGLGGPYQHDSSACLLNEETGIVAFVEEERLNRRKRNAGSRSASRSAAYCLDQAGIGLADVDEVVVGWNPRWPADPEPIVDQRTIKQLLQPEYFGGCVPDRLQVVHHHVAHAASAFYCSGFEEAAVLVVDGSGDGVATTIYRGTKDGLEYVESRPFTQSLGFFYESAAEYIGLGELAGAGKMMGLAAYGQPEYHLDFIRETNDGYAIDLTRYGLRPDDTGNFDYVNFDWFRRLKRAYWQAYAGLGIPPAGGGMRFDRVHGRFERPGDFKPEHAHLAATMQQALERCLISLARRALAVTGLDRLCLAGGVILNCSANGAIQRHSGAAEIFVQPVANDAGIAIGAAAELANQRGRLNRSGVLMQHTAYGPGFSDEAVQQVLDANGISYTRLGDSVTARAADALAAGRVVGWFEGRAEGGPRALGNRSILGDPRSVETRERINREIKRREWWRPLAPSILEIAARDLVVSPGSADFMIVAHQATDRAKAGIPATVHIDGSLRPQVVKTETNPTYARLLEEFGALTGVPALLNTSFNHEAEPIVLTPADAVRTFWSTPLDALAIGGFWVEKSETQHA
jgi:carbamoyltransferase